MSYQPARSIATLTVLLAWGGIAMAEMIKFDADTVGALPSAWIEGVTGKGRAQWRIEAEPSAPSAPHALLQRGRGDFPWCVRRDVALADGFVEVKFKPLAGREDQAGGVVWRWKDGNHYYVARANALENNVSLYYTEGGSRKTIQYVDAPVARGQWHTLRVEFRGTQIRVLLDSVARITLHDAHIAGAGAVGVWTKADSVTAFDDFAF